MEKLTPRQERQKAEMVATLLAVEAVVDGVQSFRAPHNQAAIFHDLHREMDRARKRSR